MDDAHSDATNLFGFLLRIFLKYVYFYLMLIFGDILKLFYMIQHGILNIVTKQLHD